MYRNVSICVIIRNTWSTETVYGKVMLPRRCGRKKKTHQNHSIWLVGVWMADMIRAICLELLLCTLYVTQTFQLEYCTRIVRYAYEFNLLINYNLR